MGKINSIWVLVFVSLVQLLGLYSLLIGLVGVKQTETEVTPIPGHVHGDYSANPGVQANGTGVSWLSQMDNLVFSAVSEVFHSSNQNEVTYRESVSQIVLLVIDAMRVDFLSHDRMPFVSSLLDDSYACVFVSKVKAPTVTLPRIKAIVTGEVSSYWDIIQNFQSQRITQDNILWRAKRDNRKRLVFYGDDTWLKLFPDEFVRSEGVTSFYVSDFKEVDDNVTRHLDRELKSWVSWDMLILHYLGLDHIGHVHGPNSGLVPAKLQEMDRVVKRVYEYILSNAPHSMIILCGDHGMANIGGHGGNSYPEVTTPLIFLSTRALSSCHNKDWRRLREIPTVAQVDMAPTISALWGMTFPAQSAGKIVPGLLGYLPVPRQLFALYYNALHLRKFVQPDDQDLIDEFNTVIRKHVLYLSNAKETPVVRVEEDLLESYTRLLEKLSESAGGSVGEQDLSLIGTGLILCVQALLLVSTYWKLSTQPTDLILIPAIWLLFHSGHATLVNTVLLVNGFLILFKFQIRLPNMNDDILNYVHFYALPLLYFSSSYIEEEHMIRYYLWTSLLLRFLFFTPPDSGRNERAQEAVSHTYQVFAVIILHRLAVAWNQTGQKWTDLNDLVDLLKEWNLVLIIVPISLGSLYYLRRERCPYLFPAALCIIWLIKVDAGIIRFITFGFLRNEPQLGYFVIAANLVASRRSGYSIRSSLLNFWTLFSLLIHRHENFPLVPLIMFQIRIVSQIFKDFLPLKDSKNLAERHLCMLWFSYAAFFYQGNSNNIASIDVNSGYVGLDSYNEYLVGLLIFCNTFSAPLLVFLGFLEENTFEEMGKEKSKREKSPALTFLTTAIQSHSVLIAIYCIVLSSLRHHLFIWSVFTPKLLYVISFTIFYCVLAILHGLYAGAKNFL